MTTEDAMKIIHSNTWSLEGESVRVKLTKAGMTLIREIGKLDAKIKRLQKKNNL